MIFVETDINVMPDEWFVNRYWTPAEDLHLRKRWEEGAFGSVIGKELSRTKNSVIGRANRLGLAKRNSGWPTKNNAAIRKLPEGSRRNVREAALKLFAQIADAPEIVPAASADGVEGTPLLELRDGQCRWPLNDPWGGKLLFCKEMAIEKSSYCACHTRRAWNRFRAWEDAA